MQGFSQSFSETSSNASTWADCWPLYKRVGAWEQIFLKFIGWKKLFIKDQRAKSNSKMANLPILSLCSLIGDEQRAYGNREN